MNRSGLTQAGLAEAAGCRQPTISRILAGKQALTEAMAERLAPVLGVSPLYLLYGVSEEQVRGGPTAAEGTAWYGRRIPVVSIAAANPLSNVAWEPLDPPEWIEIPPACQAVEVRGDSMAPVVLDGQRVIYDPDQFPQDGDLAFVRLNDGRQFIKRWWPEGPRVFLESIGARDPRVPRKPDPDLWVERDEIALAARVIMIDLRQGR